MKILKFWTENECIKSIDSFVSKYENDTITVKDTNLFFKALFGFIYRSKAGDPDEGIHELWENIQTDIEEFGSMLFCIEVWGSQFKLIIQIDQNNILVGEYEGIYEPVENFNHSSWISLTPGCQMKMMRGGLIQEPDLTRNDCRIDGLIKIVTRPRSWIQDLFSIMNSSPMAA
jgi:hypothetical protein